LGAPLECAKAARADDGDVAAIHGGIVHRHWPGEARHVTAQHRRGHRFCAALARLIGEARQRGAVARGGRVGQRLARAGEVV
jgi:hypothetical protein